MRNRALHEALRDYALEAAAYLTNELRAGAEIAYDVIDERHGGATLYRYEALTDEFIRDRWDHLRRLPACAPAARTLGNGAEVYLKLRGDGAAADAEEALRAMLEALYRDATGFDFPEQRFESVYAELELALYRDALRTAIVSPLHGVALERERADLGDGLFLIAGDKLDAPEQAVWQDFDGGDAGPNALLVLRRDIEPGAPLPLAEARERFAAAVRALRLLGRCGVALGPLAWGRVDDGRWQPLPLGLRRRGRGPALVVSAAVEPELSELVEIARRRPPSARTAWGLERFELALDQPSEAQALSDYMLALEVLFDARDEAGRASMPVRLAALCADDRGRQLLRTRVERAAHLEEQLMAGRLPTVDDEERQTELVAVSLELEDCLRALLRDVLCGYLDQNLRSAADDILIATGAADDIRAADLRSKEASAWAAPGADGEGAGDQNAPARAPTSAAQQASAGPPSGARPATVPPPPPPGVALRSGPPPPPPDGAPRPSATAPPPREAMPRPTVGGPHSPAPDTSTRSRASGPPARQARSDGGPEASENSGLPRKPIGARPASIDPSEAVTEDAGVTASDDWMADEPRTADRADFEEVGWDDPADFSAPV